MPVVYVHGIGVRGGDDGYQHRSATRDGLFKTFLFPVTGDRPDTGEVVSPLWGDAAGALRWHGKSLPGPPAMTLGGSDGVDDLVSEVLATETIANPDSVLLGVARRDLADAVDLLFSLPSEESGWDPSVAAEAARVVAYTRVHDRCRPDADAITRYPWLGSVTSDEVLLDELWQRAQQWDLNETLEPVKAPAPLTRAASGGPAAAREWLSHGLWRLRRAVVGLPASGAATCVRAATGERATVLAGDVCAYLGHRGDRSAPGLVVDRVGEALDRARADAERRPTVVVAHRMGATIVYDLLTHYRPDLAVDVLVTLGSQVGLFEELGLFRSSDPALPSETQPWVTVPTNIRHWINVVDRADVLGYCAEPVFDRARDYCYPSRALWAHSAYLRQPHFHARLARRVRRALG